MIDMTYQLEYKRDGSGFYENGFAGETLGDRKLVYRDAVGLWKLADSDNASKIPSIGITVGNISSGNQGKIVTFGYIGNASWIWTPGGPVFATSTPGELSQTAPSTGNQQIVGYAATGTLLYFTPRQIRGTNSSSPYTKILALPADQFGRPNTNPPTAVDQDNLTLYAFTVNTDHMTAKFPTPVDYVSGAIEFQGIWTNDGGTDDNGKTIKFQLDYQVSAEGESCAGSHANSPKTAEDTYASASGWIEHRTAYVSIAAVDFGSLDCIFAKFSFVTPTGVALTGDPHLLGICMRYLATPDR